MKFKINKNNFQKAIKNQYANCLKNDDNLLSCINMRIEDNKLVMCSTNGCSLFETKLNVIADEPLKDSTSISINGKMLYSIKFLKSFQKIKNKAKNIMEYVDNLELDFDANSIKIIDINNDVGYTLKTTDGTFPFYKKLIPDEKTLKSYYFKGDLFKSACVTAAVNERTGTVQIMLNPENSLKECLIKAQDSNGMETLSLIMPVEVNE